MLRLCFSFGPECWRVSGLHGDGVSILWRHNTACAPLLASSVDLLRSRTCLSSAIERHTPQARQGAVFFTSKQALSTPLPPPQPVAMQEPLRYLHQPPLGGLLNAIAVLPPSLFTLAAEAFSRHGLEHVEHLGGCLVAVLCHCKLPSCTQQPPVIGAASLRCIPASQRCLSSAA